MYELFTDVFDGRSIRRISDNAYLPLDIKNKDFREYVRMVDSQEAEDILPVGILDEARNR